MRNSEKLIIEIEIKRGERQILAAAKADPVLSYRTCPFTSPFMDSEELTVIIVDMKTQRRYTHEGEREGSKRSLLQMKKPKRVGAVPPFPIWINVTSKEDDTKEEDAFSD